jgi:hypothetical protein
MTLSGGDEDKTEDAFLFIAFGREENNIPLTSQERLKDEKERGVEKRDEESCSELSFPSSES